MRSSTKHLKTWSSDLLDDTGLRTCLVSNRAHRPFYSQWWYTRSRGGGVSTKIGPGPSTWVCFGSQVPKNGCVVGGFFNVSCERIKLSHVHSICMISRVLSRPLLIYLYEQSDEFRFSIFYCFVSCVFSYRRPSAETVCLTAS